MEKKALRKLYKEKRKDLSELEIQKFQGSIYIQVYELDFSDVQNVHIFLPIKRQKEINTYPIIQFLRNQGKKIVVGKSNFTDATLRHYVYTEKTELKISKYGIPEPVDAEELNVRKIDLVFVPLLISDKENYRVGYGKGFYDRFLRKCRKTVKTIGLNFFSPIVKIEGLDEFDVPLQKVIYPQHDKKDSS